MTEIEKKILNGEKLTQSELDCCAWGEVGEFVGMKYGELGIWTRDMITTFKINKQKYKIEWKQDLSLFDKNYFNKQPYKIDG